MGEIKIRVLKNTALHVALRKISVDTRPVKTRALHVAVFKNRVVGEGGAPKISFPQVSRGGCD